MRKKAQEFAFRKHTCSCMSLSFRNCWSSLNLFKLFLIRWLEGLRGNYGSRTVCCFASTRLRQCGGPAVHISALCQVVKSPKVKICCFGSFWGVKFWRKIFKILDLSNSAFIALIAFRHLQTWTGTPGGANTNFHTIDETQPDVECNCRWALSASLCFPLFPYSSMILNA